MAFRDLLAILTSSAQESVIVAAELLKTRWNGRVAALHAVEMPEPVATPYGSMWGPLVEEARRHAAEERKQIKAQLEKRGLAELRSIEAYGAVLEDTIAYNTLHADLTVLERADAGVGRLALEAALFKSGRPLLALPSGWRGETLGRRVLVAWSAKAQAARAVADAAPFLDETAEAVRVVTVDAKPALGSSALPGADLAAHLAHRGVKVELRNVDGLGREAEQAILDEALALDADLIVMGGYGHSRLRQFVFGGVTRVLTQTSPVPLFMAH